jgi:hypothetical protein
MILDERDDHIIGAITMQTTGEPRQDKEQASNSPEGLFGWLVRQERIHHDRLDQFHQQEQVLRAYDVTRARLRWDDDRRLDAEELGDGLSRRPAAIRARLARSRHGTLWLIEQWKALGSILDRESVWNDAQKALAFDLLGLASALRSGEPWKAAGLNSARSLVEREVAALQATLSKTPRGIRLLEAIRGDPEGHRPGDRATHRAGPAPRCRLARTRADATDAPDPGPASQAGGHAGSGPPQPGGNPCTHPDRQPPRPTRRPEPSAPGKPVA